MPYAGREIAREWTERMTIERMNYLSVTDMSAESAAAFFGGDFFKIVDAGPTLKLNMKPGARTFHCYRTEQDWNKEQRQRLLELLTEWRDKADEMRKPTASDSGNLVAEAIAHAAADAYDAAAAALEDTMRGLRGA